MPPFSSYVTDSFHSYVWATLAQWRRKHTPAAPLICKRNWRLKTNHDLFETEDIPPLEITCSLVTLFKIFQLTVHCVAPMFRISKVTRIPVVVCGSFSAVRLGKIRCNVSDEKTFDGTVKALMKKQYHQLLYSKMAPLSADSFTENFRGYFKIKSGQESMPPELFTVNNRIAMVQILTDYGLSAAIQVPIFKDVSFTHFLNSDVMNIVAHFGDKIDKLETEIDGLLDAEKADQLKYVLMDMFDEANHYFYANGLMDYGQPLFISYLEYKLKYRYKPVDKQTLYNQLELDSDSKTVLDTLHPKILLFYLHHAIQQGYKPNKEFVNFVTKKRLTFDEHKIPQESLEDLTTMMVVLTGKLLKYCLFGEQLFCITAAF